MVEAESAKQLHSSLFAPLKYSMTLAQEKGASSWLTALPIAEFRFTLHKGGFRDALCLHYRWQPTRLPEKCECRHQFTVVHALSCPMGSFPSLWHNEIHEFTATLSSEVCCNKVTIEPHLQPLSGEKLAGASTNLQNATRLGVAMNGLWRDGMKRLTWTSECSTPLPSQTVQQTSQCVVVRMKWKEKEVWVEGFERWTHYLFSCSDVMYWWPGTKCNSNI